MLVLTYTVDRGYQHGIMFAARELYQKVPDEIVASAIAFSHPGGSRKRLHFPKKVTQIPKRLMKVFGLRPNQIGWFNKLADNEDFIRLVGMSISPEDWKYIPLYDTTLLKGDGKEATAPQLEGKGGATRSRYSAVTGGKEEGKGRKREKKERKGEKRKEKERK